MRKRFLLISLVLCFGTSSIAQKTDNDAALWLQFELEKKLNRNWRIQLAERNKIDQNFSRFSQASLEMELEYKLLKNLRTGLIQRATQDRTIEGNFRTKYRSGFYFLMKKETGLWKFTERLLIQTPYYSFRPPNTNERAKPWKLRCKTVVHREINKYLEVYTGTEVYFNVIKAQSFPLVSRIRLLGGVDYNLSKNTTLQAGLIFQHKWRRDNPVSNDFIYQLSIKRSLD